MAQGRYLPKEARHTKGKILFVASVSFHLERFHGPFMKALMSEGYQVHAASSPSPDHRLEDMGVSFFPVDFRRSPYSFGQVKAYMQIRRLIEAQRYDMIHTHTPAASFLTRLAAWRTCKSPVLYTAHGFHFYRGAPFWNWALYWPAELLAAKWTSGLIVMNSEDYGGGLRLGFQPGRSLFFVHGVGCDLSLSDPRLAPSAAIRKSLGIPQNSVVVSCVGELNANKNHSFLLDAWKGLDHRRNRADLLIAGEGPLGESLRRRVRSENLPRVHFLGFRQDILEIQRESDISVLVSKREGLPRAIMEAMACGLPVIATDIRGNRDLVSKDNGILVPLSDVSSLTEALSCLISDEDRRRQLGAKGLIRMSEYDLPKVVQEMMEIYRRFLVRKPGERQ